MIEKWTKFPKPFFKQLYPGINPVQEGVLIPKTKIGPLKFYYLFLFKIQSLLNHFITYWNQKDKANKNIKNTIKTDVRDIKHLLAYGSVLVYYDKYKLLFLTAVISCYRVSPVFSKKKKKMPDGIEKPIAHYARTMAYMLHINWHISSSYQ